MGRRLSVCGGGGCSSTCTRPCAKNIIRRTWVSVCVCVCVCVSVRLCVVVFQHTSFSTALLTICIQCLKSQLQPARNSALKRHTGTNGNPFLTPRFNNKRLPCLCATVLHLSSWLRCARVYEQPTRQPENRNSSKTLWLCWCTSICSATQIPVMPLNRLINSQPHKLHSPSAILRTLLPLL